MKLIYFVVSCIFAAVCWIATQINWQYANILLYVALFITSWYINLIFLYQEDHESSKKYTIFTPSNLIYLIIISVILFNLRSYNIKDYETVKYAFYKIVALVNAGQALIIVLFFKFRDIYVHA